MLHKQLSIKTPKHDLKVDAYVEFVKTSAVKLDKELFTKMCKEGCVNFDKKYCCPPLSPEFNKYVDKPYLMLLLLKIDLGQLKGYKDYHRLRVGNVVIKSKAERMMRELEGDSKFLSNGACRLCKPCRRKLKKPCKHPDKMRYSLESLGVDCNKLVKDVFGFPLQWYKDKKAPEYTCVVCGLPCDDIGEEFLRML
ncbi:DUF2284 domain-containing protein [Candidatus Woesearchaeota archaeon]|nr:DUF2284 domain-containing protein [Candidatus Woesearchaeota archaeon]